MPLQGYLALPSGAGPWPGVVVVHEIFGRAFRDIETARLTLLERTDVTDRLGIIGFCMGGGFALLTADADRYAAASVNYGILPKDLDSVATLCPVVGSYGAQDRALREPQAA